MDCFVMLINCVLETCSRPNLSWWTTFSTCYSGRLQSIHRGSPMVQEHFKEPRVRSQKIEMTGNTQEWSWIVGNLKEAPGRISNRALKSSKMFDKSLRKCEMIVEGYWNEFNSRIVNNSRTCQRIPKNKGQIAKKLKFMRIHQKLSSGSLQMFN